MSASAKSGADAKWYINIAISIGIMIFFRFLPAPEPMTEYGMTVLGLFIGAIYGWCTCDMIIPSIAALVLYGFTGEQTPVAVWGSVMTNPNVSLCFWIFTALGAMEGTKLTEWAAKWSIAKATSLDKSPWVIVSVAFLGYCVIATLVSAIVAIVLFFPIFQNFAEEAGYERGDKTSAWMMFTVVFMALITGFILPFHLPVVSAFGFAASGAGDLWNGTYNYGAYLALMILVFVLDFVVYMLVSRFCFKIDLDRIAAYKPATAVTQPMTSRQKAALVIVVLMIVVLIVPSFAPAGSVVAVVFNRLNSAGIGMLAVLALLIVRVDGRPLATFSGLAGSIVWPMIFMFGTAVTFANQLNAPTAGFGLWVKGIVSPVLSGLSPLMFVVVFSLLCMVLTQFVNNVVISAVMLTLSFGFCQALGLNPIAMAAAQIMFIDFGFLLPSSSPVGSLMWSIPDWLPHKYIHRFGFPAAAILFVVAMVAGWPLANVFFPWTW